MCFHSARASSGPGGPSGGSEVEILDTGLEESAEVDLAAEVRGCMYVVLGTGALDLRAGILALAGVAVAERREARERIEVGAVWPVSVAGEQGAVLKCSEGVGDVMLASPSREVSEIKMEGLSAVLSDELDLWISNSARSALHSWSIGCLADAASPRWWWIRSKAWSGGQCDMMYLARRSCTFDLLC